MKIVQFGLCHSPNLGDGIISDCIGYGLRQIDPGVTYLPVDLSGRTKAGDVAIRNRALLLAVLDRLPRPLRQRLALWKLNRVIDGVEPDWRRALDGADLAIIGGGQILSDANLNFPVKLARCAALLAETGVPCVIHAAGASRNWTPRGTALFRALLSADLRRIGLRDAGAIKAVTAQLPGAPAPVLTPDPGLLAAGCYGPPAAETAAIGLCVTDFGLLHHHADTAVAGSGQRAEAFYAALAETLLARHPVTLFSNGAAEDRALLHRVAAHPSLASSRASGHLSVPDHPETPRELSILIGGCRAVVAHRLHACIVAHSYGRPTIGLSWDSKLGSFFHQMKRSAYILDRQDISPKEIAGTLDRALAEGVAADQLSRATKETLDALRAAVEAVSPAAEA